MFNDKPVVVGVKVDAGIARAFHAKARTHGGASKLLRNAIHHFLGADLPAPADEGKAEMVPVRLRPGERMHLRDVARSCGMTSAGWVRALVLTRLQERPQWSAGEADALRAVGNGLREVARTIERLAAEAPAQQAEIMRASVGEIRDEIRKGILALLDGNDTYWRRERSTVDHSARPQGREERASV